MIAQNCLVSSGDTAQLSCESIKEEETVVNEEEEDEEQASQQVTSEAYHGNNQDVFIALEAVLSSQHAPDTSHAGEGTCGSTSGRETSVPSLPMDSLALMRRRKRTKQNLILQQLQEAQKE